MKYLKNVSNKIVGGLGESFLPGTSIEYTEELKTHPTISFYLNQGILKLTDGASKEEETESEGVSDEERKRIAEEAVAAYQKQQEEAAAKEHQIEETIAAIKKMKKADLEAKAVELGVTLTGSDTNEQLQEKLISKVRE